ncbi:hypothetical protein [Halalkalibacter wakoensis]|nr:hypothetical protein [Halalkalibacter wakoensis]
MIVKENKWSVSELLTRAVELKPDREALYDLRERITYQQLHERLRDLLSI